MKDTNASSEGWNETKGKLQQRFAILTDSDVLFLKRKQAEMLERLQVKLNKAKEEINKIIAEM